MSKTNLLARFYSKIFTNPRRFIHRCEFKMNKAYLRHNPDGEHFDITFQLTNDQINRTFNLSRKLSENIDSFLIRVQVNVDKAINKKKRKKSTVNEETASVALLLDNKEVPKDQTCEEVFTPGSATELSINGKVFNVVVNAPWVLTINLPASILATFPTYPSKFETLFTRNDISKFTWFRSKDKINWEEVGGDLIYIPGNKDIDYFLKCSCIPKNDQLEGPVFEAVSSSTVQASPGECPFEKRHGFTKDKLKGQEFRVVSYNILADLYCDSDYTRESLFPYCPPYALHIDYRKQLFLKEIIGYNADIICLQEVDGKVHKYDLEPALSHLGYETIFHLKGGEVTEGLAFFYNKSRFIIIDSQKLLFSEHINKDRVVADIWDRIKGNNSLMERILGRTTTLQINVLGSLEHNEVLVVANTHLYFHPDADHIRLLHGCLAIRYLESYVSQAKKRYEGKRVSLVFCGDFNSVPTCGIYKLYTTGFVPGDFVDYSSNAIEAIENIDMRHTFKLDSACGTPKYTNFTTLFADCLDYIFYEEPNLSVSQVIPLPIEDELRAHKAIPSIVFPSDHVALVSDLRWT